MQCNPQGKRYVNAVGFLEDLCLGNIISDVAHDGIKAVQITDDGDNGTNRCAAKMVRRIYDPLKAWFGVRGALIFYFFRVVFITIGKCRGFPKYGLAFEGIYIFVFFVSYFFRQENVVVFHMPWYVQHEHRPSAAKHPAAV